MRTRIAAVLATSALSGLVSALTAIPASASGGAGEGIAPAAAAGSTIYANHSGRCLDVPLAGAGDGTGLIQWDCHNGANQVWHLDPVDGWFRIRNGATGKCVNVAGSSLADGAKIQQYRCGTGGANEQFTFDSTSEAFKYRIRARHSGSCLNVAGNSTANGARVQQYRCGTGGQNELWTLT